MSITNDLSKLANSANVLVNSITVNSTAIVNEVVAGTISVGNSVANVVVNSSSISVGGTPLNATSFSGTANNTLYVGSVTAANIVSNAQLSSNLANYALLSGGLFTGSVNATSITTISATASGNLVANNANTTYDLNVGRNLYVSGNLTIGSNVNVIGANNLSIIDNMIYLNSNSTWANPDIGLAANYNDGTYHHTGIFRDHNDGSWKVFDNYLPEPDANIYIQTTNTTFHLANFQANTFYAGNTSANWGVVNTSGIYTTGVVNATSYNVGTAFTANSTLTNTASLVVSTNTATIGTGTYFVSNGNVGIGTSSPSKTLEIRSSTAGSSNGVLKLYGTNGGDRYTGIDFHGITSESWNKVAQITSQVTNGGNGTGAAISGDLIFKVNSSNASDTVNEVMRIVSSGYVNIQNSVRSPVFYDYDNTAYYVDPASTTNLNTTVINGVSYLNGFTIAARYNGGATPSTGYLLTTNIPFSAFQMPKIRIQGYAYGNVQIVDFSVSYYQYNNAFTSISAINNGTYNPGTVYLSTNSSGNVCLWWSANCYYARFTATIYSAEISSSYLTGWTITEAASPATNQTSVTYYNQPYYGYNSYASSLYSTILYDSDNTGYYVDPASTSNLNNCNVNGTFYSPGAVIQVKQAVISSVFSTTSTTFVDVTSLGISITPKSSSSKILVMVSLYRGCASAVITNFRLTRAGTPIYLGDAAGSKIQSSGAHYVGASDNQAHIGSVDIKYVDSPATTSAITYQVQMRTQGGETVYVGRTGNDSDGGAYPRVPASIIVMEIAQ